MIPSHQAPPPLPAAVFPDLNNMQVNGWQCVVCHTDFMPVNQSQIPASVVVGTSGSTGQPVRACEVRCAPLIGYVPPINAVQETLL